MKTKIALYLFIGAFVGCNSPTETKDESQSVSVTSSDDLSPKDLGITKQRFTSYPEPHEVAIFRSRNRSKREPQQNQTYDQIYWTNGGQATNDVVIAPLSFYMGYPEPEGNSREQLFRDSWHLQAGGYGYDIKQYTFVESSWSSSTERATGKVVYTKNNVTKSEDLIFEFEMFVLSIPEAKRLHPELKNLEAKIKKGTTSWQAAYHLNEEAEQVGAGDAEEAF